MKIFCHNFNPGSNSGPNKFTRQLMNSMMENNGVKIVEDQNKADAEFALIHMTRPKVKPLMLRLDGIYFNKSQNYTQQNTPIQYSYENANHVVFQSKFNKSLTEHWFGKHPSSSVIHNAADISFIEKIEPASLNNLVSNNSEVWSCASSWRPHKRLEDNLRFFIENADHNVTMLVAGKDADLAIIKKYNILSGGRIFYLGDLDYIDLLSVYKLSSTFVHLSYLDHCPNVVVDAQAAGCRVICSSAGGTKEIVYDGDMILEKEWDFSPLELYNPPKMNFSNSKKVLRKNEKIPDIKEISNLYFSAISNMI